MRCSVLTRRREYHGHLIPHLEIVLAHLRREEERGNIPRRCIHLHTAISSSDQRRPATRRKEGGRGAALDCGGLKSGQQGGEAAVRVAVLRSRMPAVLCDIRY